VSQQLGRDGTLAAPKSRAGHRRLSIPDWLVEDLAVVLASRGLTAADPSALVFASSEGQPLHYSNWRRRTWVPACKAIGLPTLRFHDLRSMSATALLASGVDVKTAHARLGHASPSVTLGIYARATAEGDRAAAEAIGRYFRAPSDTAGVPTTQPPRPTTAVANARPSPERRRRSSPADSTFRQPTSARVER
jgi:integrase